PLDMAALDMAALDMAPPDAALPACEGEDVWPAVGLAREGRFIRFIAPADGIAPRRITVFLPAGYDANAARRYPVFYMHDGQNLFDPREAAFGQDWAVDDAINGLGDAIAPIIVVGIDNTADRIFEYTPSVDPERGAGGGAALYGAFLVEQLKPFIDARLRTHCHDTGVGGSSLGGLLSLHLWLQYPQVFQRVAAVSPSFWWNGRAILDQLDVAWPAGARVWIDGGGAEGDDPGWGRRSSAIEDSRAVAEAVHATGAPFPAGLGYHESPFGEHNEASWRRRLPALLTWLYGPPLGMPVLTARLWSDAQAGVALPVSVDAHWPPIPGASGLVLTLPHAAIEWMGGVVVDGAIQPVAGLNRLTASWRGQSTELNFDAVAPAQVEFRVRVPDQPVAEAVFLTGDAAALGTWDPAGVPLRNVGGVWTASVSLPAGVPFAFKVTRGSWETVEKGPNGEEIADRDGVAVDGVVEVEVARWADSP
ncbi:MAG: putative alpha/beta superfamily hydrolase, partial [Bradymonadia bacterium]